MKPDQSRSSSRVWYLVARKLTGEANQDELIELEVALQTTPDGHYITEILTLWWRLAETSGKEEADQTVFDLLQQLEKENENYRVIKKRLLTILPVA